jgi:hypothetical protein
VNVAQDTPVTIDLVASTTGIAENGMSGNATWSIMFFPSN